MSIYAIRSSAGELRTLNHGANDTLFANERYDGEDLGPGTYTQCTFANVSFKESTLDHCHFSGCVFEGCYFRKTTIDSSSFTATRFIDCLFIKPEIRVSDFRTSRFTRCWPPFGELRSNLPREHNLREELTATIAAEAEAAGNTREARLYRVESLRAREQNLLAAAKWENSYYESHYPGWRRAGAAWRYVLSRLNGLLWGHGERGRVLLVNLILVAFLIMPLLFWFTARDGIHAAGHRIDYGNCISLSVASLVNSAGLSGLTVSGWAEALAILETTLGLVFLGLFVTYVFRFVTRR